MIRTLCLLIGGLLLATFSGKVNAATPQKADANTIALWSMDDVPTDVVVVKDQSGHQMDMKIAGEGTLQFVPGLFGQAVDGFDPQSTKDNRYLTPPAYKLANPSTQTFEAWICWPTDKDLPSREKQTLWRNAGSRAPLELYFLKDKDGDIELTLSLRDAKKFNEAKMEPATCYLNETPKAGTWYHLAYTIEPQGENLLVTFHFNPQTITETSPKPLAQIKIDNFKFDSGTFVYRLGEQGQTGSDPFKGMIDDVRLSNIARTTFDTLAP